MDGDCVRSRTRGACILVDFVWVEAVCQERTGKCVTKLEYSEWNKFGHIEYVVRGIFFAELQPGLF